MENLTKAKAESLLTGMWKAKAFDFLQQTFGAENVYILKPYKGNSIRKVEHYGTSLEIWRQNERQAVIFASF